jgi:hypothetical protein
MGPRRSVSSHQILRTRPILQLHPSIPMPELVQGVSQKVGGPTWYVVEARNRFLSVPLRPRPMEKRFNDCSHDVVYVHYSHAMSHSFALTTWRIVT